MSVSASGGGTGAAPILIVGAGGHGRGILEILVAAGQGECVVGFLDDGLGSEHRVGGLPVVGTVASAASWSAKGAVFLLGVGEPLVRRTVARKLDALGAAFASAVHPRATLYREVEVGPGAVVAAGVVVAAKTTLGPHSLLNLNATVGHDCRLEAFATVAPGANLGGFVHMAEAAFVGLNGTVVPGRNLGRECRLGPGSVLLEDLGERRIAFGVPARVVDRVRVAED